MRGGSARKAFSEIGLCCREMKSRFFAPCYLSGLRRKRGNFQPLTAQLFVFSMPHHNHHFRHGYYHLHQNRRPRNVQRH